MIITFKYKKTESTNMFTCLLNRYTRNAGLTYNYYIKYRTLNVDGVTTIMANNLNN